MTQFCLILTTSDAEIQDHAPQSTLKSLWIQAFESLEAFEMYYAIGASVSSDSLILLQVRFMHTWRRVVMVQ